MAAAPLKKVQSEGKAHKPDSVQKRATLHPETVRDVAEKTEQQRIRRGRGRSKSSSVTVSQKHPALVMAHALGVPEEHVQITADGERWGCVIWNHPGPWPGQQ